MFCIYSAAGFRAAFIDDSFSFFFPIQAMHLVERTSSSHSLCSFLVNSPASSSIWASEESHMRKFTSERWSCNGPFSPPPLLSCLLSCLLFMISPRWRACLQSSFLLTFIFSFQLPAAVGEASTFGFTEHMANKFFKPDGVRSLTITYMTVVFYLFWQTK